MSKGIPRKNIFSLFKRLTGVIIIPKTVVLFSLLVIVLVGIVSAQQAGDECVVPDPLRDGLYAAHPTDCGQYLQCLHGRFVARLCAGGI